MTDNKSLHNSNAYFNEDNSLKTNACLYPVCASDEITIIKVFYSFLGSIGLIENIGVILVISFKRIMLDSPSNWFVLSLAIADAVTCLCSILLVFIIDIDIGAIHMIFGVTAQFAMLSSTGNLFLLTFNRFLSVYNSLTYPAYMTTCRAKCLVWVPWITACLITAVLGYSYQVGIQNMTYMVTTYYTVLIFMISALNVYMFKQARDKRKHDIRHAVSRPKGKLLKREHRLFVRLIVINMTFFGSCIPMIIMFYQYPTKESRLTSSFIHKFIWCYLGSVSNAAIDPPIYFINHPIFKRYFKKLQVFNPSSVPPVN